MTYRCRLGTSFCSGFCISTGLRHFIPWPHSLTVKWAMWLSQWKREKPYLYFYESNGNSSGFPTLHHIQTGFFQVSFYSFYFKGCLALTIISSRKWEREIYRMECKQAGQLLKDFLLKTWYIKHVTNGRQPWVPVLPSSKLVKYFDTYRTFFGSILKLKKNQFNTSSVRRISLLCSFCQSAEY